MYTEGTLRQILTDLVPTPRLCILFGSQIRASHPGRDLDLAIVMPEATPSFPAVRAAVISAFGKVGLEVDVVLTVEPELEAELRNGFDQLLWNDILTTGRILLGDNELLQRLQSLAKPQSIECSARASIKRSFVLVNEAAGAIVNRALRIANDCLVLVATRDNPQISGLLMESRQWVEKNGLAPSEFLEALDILKRARCEMRRNAGAFDLDQVARSVSAVESFVVTVLRDEPPR